MFGKLSTCVAVLTATTVFADSALAGVFRRGTISPVMGGQNFPDPSLIRHDDGWHAFATNAKIDGKLVHVQMGFSPDFKKWTFRGQKDAMPKLAPWVNPDSPKVWAPDVNRRHDGTWIMYYAAALKSDGDTHCVSYATANTIEGPYTDTNSAPWICPAKKGGAIDPSGYIDSSGNRWVVYKVDGNSIGNGGECNNGVAPIVSTPIMLQQVDASNGYKKIGDPIQLITNGKADGPNVENPSLSYLGGKYVLFFSSQCFATTKYDVSYAIADKITGPYKKYGPLFVTGTEGLSAPGGLDIAVNGNHSVWHGYVDRTQPFGPSPDGYIDNANKRPRNSNGGRAMFTGILSLKGTVVHAQV